MRRIGRLLILAGPTACGKSTFLQKLSASEFAPLREQLGLGPIEQWPRMAANRMEHLSDLELESLVLHDDFLWPPGDPTGETPVGARTLSLVAGADEVTLVTLWTPRERLESQLIHGKLRAAMPYTPIQIIKGGIFRLMPVFALRRLARIRFLDQLNRWYPRRLLIHHLLTLRTYSSAERVAALYHTWLKFCDLQIPTARNHLIVEFDKQLQVYSRDEWDVHIASGGFSR